MTAMEKAAWFELIMAIAVVLLVSALYPWLGDGALGVFGLLGVLGGCYFFVRQRGTRVTVDERDREIDQRARFMGIYTAWMIMLLTLIAVVVGGEHFGVENVPVMFLTWLIWIQCAICVGIKGLVGVLSYRRQNRAA